MLKINLNSTEKLDIVEGYLKTDRFKNVFAKSFINQNYDLKMEDIQKQYVPKLKCDIFISYCHDDEQYAKAIASRLISLGYSTFIDYEFWDSIDEALRKYDNKHSLQQDGTYNYKKRNESTSTFHMILTDSIIETVRNSKVYITINTNNYAIGGRTVSPWVYLENKIANEQPDFRKNFRDSALKLLFESVTFPVDLKGYYIAYSFNDVKAIIEKFKGYLK